MRKELDALIKENRELNRKLALIEARCRQAIKLELKTKYFATEILKIAEVEK